MLGEKVPEGDGEALGESDGLLEPLMSGVSVSVIVGVGDPSVLLSLPVPEGVMVPERAGVRVHVGDKDVLSETCREDDSVRFGDCDCDVPEVKDSVSLRRVRDALTASVAEQVSVHAGDEDLERLRRDSVSDGLIVSLGDRDRDAVLLQATVSETDGEPREGDAVVEEEAEGLDETVPGDMLGVAVSVAESAETVMDARVK